MFMDAEPTAPTDPNPPNGKPSQAAALIHLIQILIDFGQQRLAALRSHLAPQDTQDTGIAFGTFNRGAILARIFRGLRLATVLQQRIAANAQRVDAPLRPSPPARSRPKRPPRKPTLTEAEDNAALLVRLPTDAEIAAMLRHRPIGTVLVNICADLGIGVHHPLWQDVKRFLYRHGGQELPAIKRTYRRLDAARREVIAGIAPGWKFYSGIEHIPETTGPPHTQPA